MAWKKLVATVALGTGLGLGVVAPVWAQAPMTDLATLEQLEKDVQGRVSRTASAASHVDVDVDESGVVTLTGFVESESEKASAVEAARSIPGVTEVREDMRVIPIYAP